MTIAKLQQSNHVHPLKNRTVANNKQPEKTAGKIGKPFGTVLNEKIANQGVRFSAHAIHRMDERSITRSHNDLERLNAGVERAKAKGSKDSMVLMDEMAYIVSVKNQTVITALTKEMSKDNVFTNIDSVAIV